MKRKFLLIATGIFVSCMLSTTCHAKTYLETMVVLEKSENGFRCMPYDDFVEYVVDVPRCELNIGDVIRVTMDDCGTSRKEDDKVVVFEKTGCDMEMKKSIVLSKAKDTIGRIGIELKNSGLKKGARLWRKS